jgi:hypothetical protein
MPNFKHKDVLSGECTDCSRARVTPWQRSLPYLLIALLTAACGSTGSGEEGDTQPPGNEAPVAVAYGVSTAQNVELVIDVLANDTDADAGDTLTVSSVTQPANGSVVNNMANVTYTSNTGFSGTDTFTYVATDDTAMSNSATVTVTAAPPPAGNIVRVPEDYSTIAAAISAADSGDTVLVGAGTYSETGTINIAKDLTLASVFIDTGNENDIFNTVITGGGRNDVFIVSGGANFRVEGLTLENTGKPITIDVGHGIIRHNVIRDNSDDSISFEGDASRVAEFNTIVSNDNGIAGGDNIIVLNNIISDNRLGVTDIDGDSRLDYTMFLNNSLSGVPSSVQGSNIVFDDPRLNPDGSLQSGSPAIDAGVSGYTWQGEIVLSSTTFNGSAPDMGWMEVDGT